MNSYKDSSTFDLMFIFLIFNRFVNFLVFDNIKIRSESERLVLILADHAQTLLSLLK